MVFMDKGMCSHQGMPFLSQGKWVQEAVCAPIFSRPHLVLVASQSCLALGLVFHVLFRLEDLGVWELMVVTFNNAHLCWTQSGPSKHGNNRCKLDKTKSCLIFKQRHVSYWKHVFLVPPRHSVRKPGCEARPCVLSKEEKEGSVRMKGTGEDALSTYIKRQKNNFIPKYKMKRIAVHWLL